MNTNRRVSMVVWNDFSHDSRVLKEAQTLQAAGYLVKVCALHRSNKTAKRETLVNGISLVRVPTKPFWKRYRRHAVKPSSDEIHRAKVAPKLSLGIQQYLRSYTKLWVHVRLFFHMVFPRPSIVHGHDVNTLFTAWLAARTVRCPLVYDAHEISTDSGEDAAASKFNGWLEKRFMPAASASITTTDIRARYFSLAYGIPRPLVLQNRPRLCEPQTTNKIREILALCYDWPIVLYQGCLIKGRGLERLVDAARRVDGAYFVFIGGGDLAASLKQRVIDNGLENKVYFIDTVPLDQLLMHTASADIGVQPIENTCLNHYSTDSNKLFEYTMAGLPVIATNMPEIRKIVASYDLGITVKPSDTTALAAAIQTLIADPGLRDYYRNNACQARRVLNWEGQEHKLLSLYQGIDYATSIDASDEMY